MGKRKGRPPKNEIIEQAKRKLAEEDGKTLTKSKKAKIELNPNIPSIDSIIVPSTTGILSTSIEEILKDVKSRLTPMDQDHPEMPSKCSETDTESISEKLSETCESVVSQEDTKSIIDELNSIKNIKQEPGDTTDTEIDTANKQKNLDKKQPVRRSGRPRKSTLKEREIASPKLIGKMEIKVETTIDETSRDSAMTSLNDDMSQITDEVIPLHIDTVDKCSTPTVELRDKASSLSPLESEGVSEISVKQFYGEPAFLENNRGIEKDPKLGEIVQVHEKKSLVQNVDENAIMDSDSIENNKENLLNDFKLLNEKEDLDFLKEDESLGELKMDDSIDEELEEKLLNSDDDTQLKDFKIGDIKIDDKLKENLVKDEFVTKEKDSENNNNLIIDEDQTTNCSEETAIVTEDNTPITNIEESAPKNTSDKPSTKEILTEHNVKPAIEEKKIFNDEKKNIVEKKKNIVDGKKNIVDEKKEMIEDKIIITDEKKSVVEEGKKVVAEEAKVVEEKIKIPIIDEKTTESEKENIENKKSIVSTASIQPSVIKAKSKDIIKMEVAESPETLKLKETHLKLLGLLTIKEADEAKKEKQRQKEIMQSSSASSTSSTGSGTSKSKSRNTSNNNNNTNSNGNNGKDKDKEEYTGTLKTVIKVPRPSNNQNEKRKRLPLKMTFQKGRGKNGNEKDSNAPNQSGDDVYYTIQNEGEGHDTTSATTHGGHNSSRKTHNRTHTDGNIVSEPSEITTGQEVKKALVIPEKASSFSIHPGRVCRDQCFYCGGKFGLFDTPCHVAQIKSLERQKKILDNEEKLTVDSCLCDACYRHVDRRANCPSYKKRLSAPGALSTTSQHNSERSRDNSSEESGPQQSVQKQQGMPQPKIMCRVTNCNLTATQHSLRRKWFLKMKKSIEKLININLEANSSHLIPICDNHYDAISHLMICSLCKRKLAKNHIFYIYQDIDKLEIKLTELGIPVSLGTTPVVCKICRYFANLLLKPPEPKTQKAQFIKTYRSRLLQFRSIEIMETSDSDNNNQIPHKIQHPPVKSKPKVSQTITKAQKTPQKESFSFTPQENFDGSGGHILLDNDVMVNYDVPMMDINTQTNQQKRHQQHVYGPKHPKLPRYSNDASSVEANNDMARILRANPNISMRELLPGEEDLGMYATIPFHCGKKTPEGWSKVQTIIQYDDVTKQMFEELQKPYGNQSSFLRHLVLLEKYFRNGELVLSQNASYNAMSYSESVQTRLKSYDNIPTGGLPIMQQLSIPIEITPTVTIKPKQKLESRNNSLLVQTPVVASLLRNSNNPHHPSTSSQQYTSTKTNRQISVTTESNQHEILAAASKYIKLDETTITPAPKKSSGAIPPELISITKTSQPAIAITPITNRKSPGPNISSPPASISTASTPPVPTASTSASISISNVPSTSSSNSGCGKPSASSLALQQQQHQNPYQQQKQIIKLPETLGANERKQPNGKPWRPTLLPITPGTVQQQGLLYQAADGRRLPSLVQVMSGGKPYHISIDDYNRMCILRREKLIQLQMSKEHNSNNNHNTSGSSTNSNNSSSNIGNGSGTMPTINNNSNKQSSVSDESNNRNNSNNLSTFVGANNKKLHIPNKILEQNSLIPVGLKSNNLNERKRTKSAGNSNSTSLLKTHIPIAPKPPQLPNSTTVLAVTSSSLPSSITATVMKSISQSPPHTLTITTTNSSSSSSTIITTSTATVTLPPSIEMIKTTGGGSSGYSWANNQSMDQTINGYTISTPSSGGGTLLIDNSAVSVLSKIPKSLTVIPQQKGRSRVSSIEDLTSA